MSYNEAVYGHNRDEGIVCIDVWGKVVTEFIQTDDGRIVCNELDNFDPWYIVHSMSPNLTGDNHFNTLKRVPIKKFKHLYDQKEHIEDMLLVGNKSDNYMVDTGKTLFKGMTFDEVHTLGFDIETTGLNPEESEVKMISLVDNRGFEKLIYHDDEFKVLSEFIELFNRLDPTIVLSYNGFRFDIPFLIKRCEVHGIELSIGRNLSQPIESKIMVRMGTGQQDYQQAWRIWGRHCIDLYYAVVRYDFTDRSLNNYKLKNVISQYGLEREGRVHVGYEEILEGMSSGDPTLVAKISEYCLDDSRDLLKLHTYICQADFYLTQIIPMNYQRVMYSGSVGRINNLIIRDYLLNDTSIPVWRMESVYIEGGKVEANEAGIFKYVGDFDIISMYPNLMEIFDIFPESDILHTMKRTLIDLKNSRLTLKQLMKDTEPGMEKARLDGQQKAMKILINSYFGVLGSPGFFWRDNAVCASVTEHGRDLILKMRDHVEALGYKVVSLDTDGIACTNGEPIDIDYVNTEIQSMLPMGIEVEAQEYKGIVVFKKRTYAILKEDWSIQCKGAALTSSKMAPLVKKFIGKSIEILFNVAFGRDTLDSLKAYYEETVNHMYDNEIPINDYTLIQRVQKDIEEYESAKGTPTENGGTRSKLPLYELMLQTNRRLRAGEKTETYWSVKEIPKPLTTAQLRKRAERDLTMTLFEVEEVPKMMAIKALNWVDQHDAINSDVFVDYYMDALNNRIYDLLSLVMKKEDFFSVFTKMSELSVKVAKVSLSDKEIKDRFVYKDLFGKFYKEWKRISVAEEIEYIKESGSDLYVTVQRFANDEPIDGELVYHPIYFDIDSPDLDKSLVSTQRIVKIFKNVLNVQPDCITVWFSGSKGFHIEIDPEVFGIQPMAGLTLINKHIAMWLIDEYKIDCIDTASIYSSRRMWRLPFTIHGKTGIRKTWIDDVLAYEDMDDLMVYIKAHQDLDTEFNAYYEMREKVTPVTNKALKSWFNEYFNKYRYDLSKAVIKKPSWKFTKLKGKLPGCVEFIREQSIIYAGDRNLATLNLLTFFRESGVDYDQAVENVVNWTQRIPSGLTSTVNYGIIKNNVQSIAKSVYKDSDFGKKYVFECGYMLSLMKGRPFECSVNCPLKE